MEENIMPKIFVSYRREDSAYPAQQIYRDLIDRFGSDSVVFDVDSIPFGTDFRDYINEQVSKCDILLAVIGDQWIEILKQRLNEPNDFIRIEIQAALERRIPVVPVLVGKATVPNEKELPPEIVKLTYKQAAEVRAGSDYPIHLKRLIDGLDNLINRPGSNKNSKSIKGKTSEKNSQTYSNTIGMNFILIPAGSFTMGSKNGEKCERPPHEVNISKAFYLQTTPVTQGQWQKVMGGNPSKFKDCGTQCPVDRIGWSKAQGFIKRLNKMEGLDRYRLPTEAEWEYACRAGTTTDFFFGADANQLNKYAWFEENSKSKTHPVERKKPNNWGLYDMHGNINEWVEDSWRKNYDEAPIDGSAWYYKPENEIIGAFRKFFMDHRVYRGGAYNSFAKDCRSATRGWAASDANNRWFGFRLALSVSLDPK
jgi:formylglycine-generating enzyme required for sulfatase activity